MMTQDDMVRELFLGFIKMHLRPRVEQRHQGPRRSRPRARRVRPLMFWRVPPWLAVLLAAVGGALLAAIA
jgi:hypothetical protein